MLDCSLINATQRNNMAIVISLCALGFTIGTFWWMNWRPAELRMVKTIPRPIWVQWAGTQDQNKKPVRQPFLSVSMPLILWNAGAQPAPVTNLRIRITELDGNTTILPWQRTMKGSGALPEENVFATPFALGQNETRQAIFNFQQSRENQRPLDPALQQLSFDVEYSENNQEWKPLHSFDLELTNEDTCLLAAGDMRTLEKSI